jgi:hypothetical protein
MASSPCMGLLRRSAHSGPAAVAEVLALAPTRRGARETERRDVEHALELRVRRAGGPPAVINHVCRVPWDKSPRLGQRLPVTVVGRDPVRVRIRWDSVPSLAVSSLAAGAAARNGDLQAAAAALGFALTDD